MKIFTRITILLTFLFVASGLWSVEISLDALSISPDGKRSRTTGTNNVSINVGHVDVYVLFDEHPMKKRLKKSFMEELGKRKKEIDDEKNSISQLGSSLLKEKEELLKLNNKLLDFKKTSQESVVSSTSTQNSIKKTHDDIKKAEKEISEKEKSIMSMENNIKTKNEGLEKLRQKHKDELEKLERKQTALIMDDLYEIIEELAKEENITVILDRNTILYGHKLKDLTPKVRQRLKGR